MTIIEYIQEADIFTNKNNSESKKKKYNPIKEMYKSWKDKLCKKIEWIN